MNFQRFMIRNLRMDIGKEITSNRALPVKRRPNMAT
jgi:hypothetical protein